MVQLVLSSLDFQVSVWAGYSLSLAVAQTGDRDLVFLVLQDSLLFSMHCRSTALVQSVPM